MTTIDSMIWYYYCKLCESKNKKRKYRLSKQLLSLSVKCQLKQLSQIFQHSLICESCVFFLFSFEWIEHLSIETVLINWWIYCNIHWESKSGMTTGRSFILYLFVRWVKLLQNNLVCYLGSLITYFSARWRCDFSAFLNIFHRS